MAESETPFREALGVWWRIGLMSFGGPAAQIALMHRMLVDEKKWLTERQFLNALNFCMLLPGPEAQQLATYSGWLLHGVRGGLVAGLLFILPGALVLLGLSVVYAYHGQTAVIGGIFYGIKAAVLAIVVEALLRIARRVLTAPAMLAVSAVAFILIFFLAAPFPMIVIGAGLFGYFAARHLPQIFPRQALSAHASSHAVGTDLGRVMRFSSVFIVLWFAPLVAVALFAGTDSVFVAVGLFFSKMAVVTFGGAYAVLAYVAQQAVDVHGWLQPAEMLDGLGLAETTPGPLILVTQFVGFLAGFRGTTGLSPLAGGILGAAVTLWVTFVPCFYWIFLGAPYVERIARHAALSHALSAITAAVVGVVLNLAVWFSLQVLFATVDERHVGPLRLYVPDWATLDPLALTLAVAAMMALLRYHVGFGWVMSAAGLAGIVLTNLVAM